KQFNYDPHDKHAILKSDLMKDKTDEEINQYMLNNLSIYDQIGDKMNQYQKLVDNLTKLNLHNMAASIADYRQQVNDNQISFSEALLKLTDKEITYQQQESLKRRIKRARFPIIKRLNDFNYQF